MVVLCIWRINFNKKSKKHTLHEWRNFDSRWKNKDYWQRLLPIWMTELLLGRLVQFPFLAITWTVYSSPQCRSSQVQELVFVTHSWLWPSSPVATARYVWFILLAVQLTKPILELHSELVTTAMGIQGPRDLEKDVNRILTILLWFLENLHETEKQINWWI